MASTEGLEPPTVRLEGVCSIQLSYVDIYLNYYNNKLRKKQLEEEREEKNVIPE